VVAAAGAVTAAKVAAGRTLYVTNYLSEQLETISVPALVRAAPARNGAG
jgi:hypothetical protein